MTVTITTASDPATLDTGVYLVNAPCPRCGVIEEILVAIRSQLTIGEQETGAIRVKIKGKARDHDCQQRRLSLADTDREES